MRSAPTLNSWMMPFSSVAMIEKLALVRIAFALLHYPRIHRRRP